MMKTESPMPAPTVAPAGLSGATPMQVLSRPAPVMKMQPIAPPPKKVATPPPTRVVSKAHECPMFLRKTYHMVDTCDPAVASWSQDGETFVVKNTDVFEKQIIPQFFKHSKFSSFVRQLNFYGFRKIKFHDTIRIDAKLEAETANFWRFHHESFRRGRPDLLIEIKRHGGKDPLAPSGAAAIGSSPSAAAGVAKAENVTGVKSEVTVLKERITVMSKNIDNLSNLVQKMAVNQGGAGSVTDRTKRMKVKQEPVDDDVSMPSIPVSEPDVISSSLSYSPADMFPSAPPSRQQSMTSAPPSKQQSTTSAPPSRQQPTTSSPPSKQQSMTSAPPSRQQSVTSAPPSRQQSMTSGSLSDDEFLDDLVHVLEEENVENLSHDSVIVGLSAVPSPPITPPTTVPSAPVKLPTTVPSAPVTPPTEKGSSRDWNRPDPKLMEELGDALSILPKDIQEIMIKRLISTISNKDSVRGHVAAASTLSKASVVECYAGKDTRTTTPTKSVAVPQVSKSSSKQLPEIGLPMAAATLGALLTQYGMANGNKAKNCIPKSIPAMPVHHQKIPVHA